MNLSPLEACPRNRAGLQDRSEVPKPRSPSPPGSRKDLPVLPSAQSLPALHLRHPGMAASCIFLVLSLRPSPSLCGFFLILLHVFTIVGAVSGYATVSSAASTHCRPTEGWRLPTSSNASSPAAHKVIHVVNDGIQHLVHCRPLSSLKLASTTTSTPATSIT